MNSIQKRTLTGGGVLVALMILFPPWLYYDGDSSSRSPAGYHFILAKPALKSPQEMFGVPKMRIPGTVHVEVNIIRLMFQLSVAIPIVLGLVPLFSDKLTVFKTAFGVLLIGCSLFLVGFVLWLEFTAG